MSDPARPSYSAYPDLGKLAHDLATTAVDPVTGVKALGQKQRDGDFLPEDARYIYIRGYGVTSAEDKKPVLGTNGAGPCLIVAMHNPEQKTAALAHIDANTDIKSLHKIIRDMGGRTQELNVHLAGGQEVTRGMVGGVIDILKSYTHVNIQSADILSDTGLKSLAIDSRSGNLYTNFMTYNMDKGPDHNAIMSYHAGTAFERMPLRPDYVNGESYIVKGTEPTPQPVAPTVGR